MIFKVTNTATSIRITNTLTGIYVALVMRNGKFETHHNAIGRDSLSITNLVKTMKTMVLKSMNKRLAYSARISKLAGIVNKANNATTFAVLSNKVSIAATELNTVSETEVVTA